MVYSEKQTQILDVAERLFAEKGYDGTSVRDIAEVASVNPSMISYYFGSKEGLIQALFKERTSHIGLKLEELSLNNSISPMEKVDSLVVDYVERSLRKRLFFIILVTEQMLHKNEVITGLINDLKKRNIDFLESIIREGQQKGMFRKEIDIALLMNTLIGTVTQTFINQSYYKSYHQLDTMPNGEFMQLLKGKLSNYIKGLFKSILSYEG